MAERPAEGYPSSGMPAPVFSIRIVVIDYVMAKPIEGVDVCYSSLAGRALTAVPVVRIYGSTPAGQKCLLHLHKAFPYCYVPYPTDLAAEVATAATFLRRLAAAVDQALEMAYPSARKPASDDAPPREKSAAAPPSNKDPLQRRVRVHGAALVRAGGFYGYQPREQLFIKLSFYDPADVPRAAVALLSGALLGGRILQPYETHIPFLLQVLADNNLLGMAHVRLRRVLLRGDPPPLKRKEPSLAQGGWVWRLTELSPSRSASCKKASPAHRDSKPAAPDPRYDLVWEPDAGAACTATVLPVVSQPSRWDVASLPLDWRWPTRHPARTGGCELEVDASIEDALNRADVLRVPLSEAGPGERLVESLAHVWGDPILTPQAAAAGLPFMEAVCDDSGQAAQLRPDPPLIAAMRRRLDEILRADAARAGWALPDSGTPIQQPMPLGEGASDVSLPVASPDSSTNRDPEATPCAFSAGAHSHLPSATPVLSAASMRDPWNGALLAATQAACGPQAPNTFTGGLHIPAAAEPWPHIDGGNGAGTAGVMRPPFNRRLSAPLPGGSLFASPVAASSSPGAETEDLREGLLNEKLWMSQIGAAGRCAPENGAADNRGGDGNGPVPLGSVSDGAAAGILDWLAGGGSAQTESAAVGCRAGPAVDDDRARESSRAPSDTASEHGESEGHIDSDEDDPRHASQGGQSLWAMAAQRPPSPHQLKHQPSSGGDISAEGGSQENRRRRRAARRETAAQRECADILELASGPSPSPTPTAELPTLSTEDPSSVPYDGSHPIRLLQIDGSRHGADSGSEGDPWAIFRAGMRHMAGENVMEDDVTELIATQRGGSQGPGEKDAGMDDDIEQPTAPTQPMGGALHMLTPQKLPPHPSALAATWATHGLSPIAPLPIFYSDPRDLPDRPLLVTGREARLLSTAVKDLPLFVSFVASRSTVWGTPPLPQGATILITPVKRAPLLSVVTYWLHRKSRREVASGARYIGPAIFGIADAGAVTPVPPPKPRKAQKKKVIDPAAASLRRLARAEQDDGIAFGDVDLTAIVPPETSAESTDNEEEDDHGMMLAPASREGLSGAPCMGDEKKRGRSTRTTDGRARRRRRAPSPKYDELKYDLDCYVSDASSDKTPPDDTPHVRIPASVIAKPVADVEDLAAAHVMSSERKPVRRPGLVSQVTPPTVSSTKAGDSQSLSQVGFRRTHDSEAEQLTLLACEVLPATRGSLLPDPRHDALLAVAIQVRSDGDETAAMEGPCGDPGGRETLLILVDESAGPTTTAHAQAISRGATLPPDVPDLTLRSGRHGAYRDSLPRGVTVIVAPTEHLLLAAVASVVARRDPDILLGFEVQKGSWGYLLDRAAAVGSPLHRQLVSDISSRQHILSYLTSQARAPRASTERRDDAWGKTHASGIAITGRVVLNLWRIIDRDVKLGSYTFEACCMALLRRRVPEFAPSDLSAWFRAGPSGGRPKALRHVLERAALTLAVSGQLDLVRRTAEHARVFGIDFFSVLTRGSQYRVEALLSRLAHSQNMLLLSASKAQVASQPGMAHIPMVMEPENGVFTAPVVVLDFQSLYPSMMIAYNLCFTTCLGRLGAPLGLAPDVPRRLGVAQLDPLMDGDLAIATGLAPPPASSQAPLGPFLAASRAILTPSGAVFCPPSVRRGVLPRMLAEILAARVAVKTAMKAAPASARALRRCLDARQLALKLIANVTYGYAAAGFSGRMPCAELADAIVSAGRATLEDAISYVEAQPAWRARVVYGDTDSLFVHLPGRTRAEAFAIGTEIAVRVSARSPPPVKLQLDKVYSPCALLTKKRYVGFAYDGPSATSPVFDAKGIETVRRDSCRAVASSLERALRLLFVSRDLSLVKRDLQRSWAKIMAGRVSLADFVFAKEVRMGSYSTRTGAVAPPAAIIAARAAAADPRATPLWAQRVAYVVVCGPPAARLADMLATPREVVMSGGALRLNALYYLNKQIVPALQRVFGLLGCDLRAWLAAIPRSLRPPPAKRALATPPRQAAPHGRGSRVAGALVPVAGATMERYYLSRHCAVCDALTFDATPLCNACLADSQGSAAALLTGARVIQRRLRITVAVCATCGGGGPGPPLTANIACLSHDCPAFYLRHKLAQETAQWASQSALGAIDRAQR